MKDQEYNRIVQQLEKMSGLSTAENNHVDQLCRQFPMYSKDTIFSIWNVYFRHYFMNASRFINEDELYSRYQEMDSKGEKDILMRLANKYKYPATNIAKMVLKLHLRDHSSEYSKSKTGCHCVSVKMLYKNPSIIVNSSLQEEVLKSKYQDCFHGPNALAHQNYLGSKYEKILAEFVASLGVEFLTEEALKKKKGVTKTPDVVLKKPFKLNGYPPVHWIESKAVFGDAVSHMEYEFRQYMPYTEIFGSGMVIYWFGFIEDRVYGNEKYFVSDRLPLKQAITVL